MTNNEAIGILALVAEAAKGRCFVTDEAISDAYDMAIKALEKLPPAQPEIIRCKECKYSVDYYHEGDCYCLNPKLGLMYFGGSWEFYCADAERRTDEGD